MKPQEWQQIEEIFQGALQLPALLGYFLVIVTWCYALSGPPDPLPPSSFDFKQIGFFDHTGSPRCGQSKPVKCHRVYPPALEPRKPPPMSVSGAMIRAMRNVKLR